MSRWNPFSRQAPAPRIEPQIVPRQEKASEVGPLIAFSNVGQPRWTPRDYASLAEEAYNLNAIAFRCVKMIADAAAGVDHCLYSGKTELESHPILDLLARPGPTVSRKMFFEAFYGYLLLSGNSYVEAVGPTGNRPPRELWTQMPHRMKVVPGSSGLPEAYEFEVTGMRHRFEVDQLTGMSDILHVKEFHPLNDWYGMSRVEAAAVAIDQHNAAGAHNKALLDNGARPSGGLVFKPLSTELGQMITTPVETIQAAEKLLMQRHSGPANAGRPFVFGGNVEWIQMGLSAVDMDFGEGRAESAREICLAFGVPHILIVPGASTYNNVSEAKLEFYEETVLPLIEHATDALNWWLLPRFGDRLVLKPDLDMISALEPRRESKRKTTIDLFDKGLLSRREARDALDYGEASELMRVDSGVLTALINAVATIGMDPLMRYLQDTGLVDPNATAEEILAAANKLVDDTATDEPIDPEDPAATDQPTNPDTQEDDDVQAPA